jgi:hypothetical protein
LQVFDLGITLNEAVSQRDRDRSVPDVHVRLKMGQIRLVFLMKYIKVIFSVVHRDRDRDRDRDRGVPDLHVRLKMGQIRLVFLMKYIKVRFLSCSSGSGSWIPRRAGGSVANPDPHHYGKLDPDPHQGDADPQQRQMRLKMGQIRLVFFMKYIKVGFLSCSTVSGPWIPRSAGGSAADPDPQFRMDPHHFGKLDANPHQCDSDPSLFSHEVGTLR